MSKVQGKSLIFGNGINVEPFRHNAFQPKKNDKTKSPKLATAGDVYSEKGTFAERLRSLLQGSNIKT